jgi:hypothetical protein
MSVDEIKSKTVLLECLKEMYDVAELEHKQLSVKFKPSIVLRKLKDRKTLTVHIKDTR